MKIALKPVVKSFLSSLNPFYIASDPTGRSVLNSIGISAVIQDTRTVHGQISAYNYCPPLSAIIQRKARAFNNGKVWLMDKDGKESPVKEAQKLRDLMARPNAVQTWTELMTMLYTFKDIFGEAFVYALRGVGSNEVSALWVIPNWIITPKETGKIYNQSDINEIITEYTVTGMDQPLSNNDIIHIKDSVINTQYTLRGQSRMVALEDPISNFRASYEARNVLITKRGGIGILSNFSKDVAGSVPLLPKDKEELQKDFQTYGLSKSQSQVIITSASLQWQSMTFPTKDLMLFEEENSALMRICDGYEYPYALLATSTPGSLGDKTATTEYNKQLYQNAIIPDAEAIYDAFSRFFNTEKYKFSFKVFFDHLEALQKSEKDKAEVFQLRVNANVPLYEKGLITLNKLYTSLDMDIVPGMDMLIYDIQKTPYALKLGVGGTQALQVILSDPNISDDRKRNILIVVFGMTEQEARQIMA